METEFSPLFMLSSKSLKETQKKSKTYFLRREEEVKDYIDVIYFALL